MGKSLKKLIIAVIAITMLLGTVAIMAGCDNIFSEDDFVLAIEVNGVQVNANDVIEASIGDEIEVKATLSNLSGQNIRVNFVEQSGTLGMVKDNKIRITFLPDRGSIPDNQVMVPGVRMRFRRNETLSRTLNHVLLEDPAFIHPDYPFEGKYIISARASFYVNGNRSTPITLNTSVVLIAK